MWLLHGFLAVAVLAEVGADASTAPTNLPKPVVMRQSLFAIPFRVDQGGNPARQPVEVQLHVSTDHGTHWQLYAKAPPTQQRFLFRVGGDGEYWFAIRTVDRSGQAQPESIAGPGLRVLVDTKPAKPIATARQTQPPVQVKTAEKAVAAAPPAASTEPKGSVAIAINPAIGKNLAAADAGRKAEGSVSGLPPGERPRMINSTAFALDYDVDSVGPSGIGRVELWGTTDNSKTWRRFTVDNDNRSPLMVNVNAEGIYGFRVVVTNGVGLGGQPPQSGDLPDLWIGIDVTKPTARIVSAQQGIDGEAGQLIISWQADDKMLAARPVSLSFSEKRGGPWLPIASGLENTGRYAWALDSRTPSQFYLRLEVRDEAGNVGIHEMPEPVTIDQSRPTVHVREVRPVSGS